MKFKSLLLLGLSAVALSSCGGVKSYKKEVKASVFTKDIQYLFEHSSFFDSDKAFSYVLEMSGESHDLNTYYKNGKSISENGTDMESCATFKYDSNNSIVNYVEESKTINETPSSVTETIEDSETQYQTDSKRVYEIDYDAKTYTCSTASKPADAVWVVAAAAITSVLVQFTSNLGNDDARYYEDDGNKFTIVVDITESTKSASSSSKAIYQLITNDNGFDYHYEFKSETSELSVGNKFSAKIDATFKAKNVNLDYVNLNNFLELDA